VPRLDGVSAEERADLSPRMIWLRYVIAVAAILITGRIHSKRLDEQDEPDAQGYLNEAGDAIDSLRGGLSESATVQTE
jgi:hypothetical protein